jgi:hypothetical protein
MFGSAWSWLVPLLGALAVFCAVLLTTPPGVRALTDLVLGPLRGPAADAAAYALGSAASLALLALVILAAITALIDLALRRR